MGAAVALRCVDCDRMLVKGRKASRCSGCKDLIGDAARMDAGGWVPNGKGSLVFVAAVSA